jgi:23S rRNA pseudouridine1911/1915/1917 synthase
VNCLELSVGEPEEGSRLDRFLARRVDGLGRAEARRLIAQGNVRVNGVVQAKGYPLHRGENVTVEAPPVPKQFAPGHDADMKLKVSYEDCWLVVIDKPAGVPSYPLRPDERGTVAGALLARYPEMATVGYAQQQAGLLQRLDTGTSGLMVAAKSREVFLRLRRAVKSGALEKRYLALCVGRVPAPRNIEAWIVSSRKGSRKVRVTERPAERGRAARTELLASTPIRELSLVEARAGAAARHQIRAHLAWLGHPLVGDTLYGGPEVPGLYRHFLHASEIRFVHPIDGHTVQVLSALADDLRAVIDSILGTE